MPHQHTLGIQGAPSCTDAPHSWDAEALEDFAVLVGHLWMKGVDAGLPVFASKLAALTGKRSNASAHPSQFERARRPAGATFHAARHCLRHRRCPHYQTL
jgi:hypothetical protein